jgi:hypothetical protein
MFLFSSLSSKGARFSKILVGDPKLCAEEETDPFRIPSPVNLLSFAKAMMPKSFFQFPKASLQTANNLPGVEVNLIQNRQLFSI